MPLNKERMRVYRAELRWSQGVVPRSKAISDRQQEFLAEFPNYQELLATLQPSERQILTRYYIEGCTLNAIAENLGVSRQAVHQGRETALKKIRSKKT